jgi:HlyD family secretion protein
MTKRRWILLAVIALAVIVGFILFQQSQPQEIPAFQLRRETVVASLTLTGEVRAHRLAEVGAQQTTRLLSLSVDEGDSVTAGQSIAQLQPQQTQAEVAAAEARSREAQAALANVLQGARQEERQRLAAVVQEAANQVDSLRRERTAAQARLSDAVTNAQRFTTLFSQGAASAQERDNAVTQRDVAQADVQRLTESIAAAQARVTQARQQLAQAQRGPTAPEVNQAQASRQAAQAQVQQEQSRLSELTLRSPFSGTVVERLKKTGDLVKAGDPVVRIADFSSLEVIAFVEEPDLGRVHLDDTAYVIFDAYPERTLTGRITRIGRKVNPENGTLEVTVVLNSTPAGVTILPGMTADVTVLTDRLPNAMVVPVSAVSQQNNGYIVHRFHENRLAPTPVRVKRVSLEHFQVLSGLKPGDWVAEFVKADNLDKKNVTPKLAQDPTDKKKTDNPMPAGMR